MPERPRGRRVLVASSTALALIVTSGVALAAWRRATERNVDDLGDGLSRLEIRRPFVAPRYALCVAGGACTDVVQGEHWYVALDDPLVVHAWDLAEHVVREEVVLDPTTGALLARPPVRSSIPTYGLGHPVRWNDLLVETFGDERGGLVRVVDLSTGEVAHEWTVPLEDAAEIWPLDGSTFRIDATSHAYTLTLPDGPPHALVPDGVDDACVTREVLVVLRDGVLEAADPRAGTWTRLAAPGPGDITGCRGFGAFSDVLFTHVPVADDGALAFAPLDAAAPLTDGSAAYVVDTATLSVHDAIWAHGAMLLQHDRGHPPSEGWRTRFFTMGAAGFRWLHVDLASGRIVVDPRRED